MSDASQESISNDAYPIFSILTSGLVQLLLKDFHTTILGFLVEIHRHKSHSKSLSVRRGYQILSQLAGRQIFCVLFLFCLISQLGAVNIQHLQQWEFRGIFWEAVDTSSTLSWSFLYKTTLVLAELCLSISNMGQGSKLTRAFNSSAADCQLSLNCQGLASFCPLRLHAL